MSNGQGGARPTKNERREQAREEARIAREAAQKREKRNRVLMQGGIIVGALAIIALVAVLIVTSIRPAGPGPLNMASDGVLVQAGGQVKSTPALEADAEPVPNEPNADPNVLTIQTWVDYLCPYCGMFERTNGEYLESLVDSGAASLEVFPVSILDRAAAGSKYSTRAVNAVGCVVETEPSAFLDFHGLLFTNQPTEGTTGLDNDALIALAAEAGATDDDIATCIQEQRFKSWVDDSTARTLNNPDLVNPATGGFGTPTVFVNGNRYSGSLDDPDAFKAFVTQVAGEAAILEQNETPTPTATPTPTETPAS